MLRKHQNELIDLVKEKIKDIMENGRRDPEDEVADIVSEVFPGGGKSVHPIIAFKLLKEAGLVDKLCWVVPRASLKQQGAESFINTDFKNIYPHNLEIRETERTNDVDPSHGSDGYITTYQALVSARNKNQNRKNSHQYEFTKYRYFLFLDECQHTAKDKPGKKQKKSDVDMEGFNFYKSVLPLFKLAKFTIATSGTLFRHDPYEHVAFVEYKKKINSAGDEVCEPQIDLRYGYDDACTDKAVIPLISDIGSAKCVKYEKNGKEINRASIQNNTDLAVAIDSGYGEELLEKGVKSWQQYKQTVNLRSKLIIVGHNQSHCRKIRDKLATMNLRCCLAISDEGQMAKDSIESFRHHSESNILVTCQMAYEGLDCREATHLIALTKIRSIPWLMQMLTRIMRTDIKNSLKWEHQKAWAFVPDDEAMLEALRRVKANLVPEVKEPDPLDEIESLTNESEGPTSPLITNPYSELGDMTQGNLDGEDLPCHLRSKIQAYQNKYNLHQPEIDTYKMLIDMNGLSALEQFSTTEEDVIEDEPMPLTIRQKERKLRTEIEQITRKLDYKFNVDHGTWNKKAFNAFRGKGRKDMNVEELQKVKQWLQEEALREYKQRNEVMA